MFVQVIKPASFQVVFDLSVSAHTRLALSNVIAMHRTSELLYRRSGHLRYLWSSFPYFKSSDIRLSLNDKCSGFFSDFAGNLRVQKPNKAQTKRANITGVQYLRAYHQVVSTFSFILYSLFILLPHYLCQLPFSHPPLPPPKHAARPFRPPPRLRKRLLISHLASFANNRAS